MEMQLTDPDEQGPGMKRRKLLLGDHVEQSSDSAATVPTCSDKHHDVQSDPPTELEYTLRLLRQERISHAMTIRATLASNPNRTEQIPPIVLVTELHSMVKDKRTVEPGLEKMRRQGRIRMIKLPTGVDEYGVLTSDDYSMIIKQAAEAAAEARHKSAQANQSEDLIDFLATPAAQHSTATGGSLHDKKLRPAQVSGSDVELLVAEAFCRRVMPRHNEVSISEGLLLSLLNSPTDTEQKGNSLSSKEQTQAYSDPAANGSAVTTGTHAGGADIPRPQGTPVRQATVNSDSRHGANNNLNGISRTTIAAPVTASPLSFLSGLPTSQAAQSAGVSGNAQGSVQGARATGMPGPLSLLSSLPSRAQPAAQKAPSLQGSDTTHSRSTTQQHDTASAGGSVKRRLVIRPHVSRTGMESIPHGSMNAAAMHPQSTPGMPNQHVSNVERREPYKHAQQDRGNTQQAQHGSLARLQGIQGSQQLTILLQLGVIARHPGDDRAYLLGCPGMGPVVKSIVAGRKELVSIVSKKPNKEMSEKALLGSPFTHDGKSKGRKRKDDAGANFNKNSGGFFQPLELSLGSIRGNGDDGLSQHGLSKGRDNADGKSSSQMQAGGAAPKAGAARDKAQVSKGNGIQEYDTAAIASNSQYECGVRLRQSVLGVRFHLRDSIGRGDLVRMQTPAGTFARVSNKALR